VADLRQPAYESLDPDARALVDRWVAQLGRAPTETAAVLRFLLAMAAVRLGTIRELGRLARDGRPVVILVDPHSETFYEVADPRLAEAKRDLVDEMLRVLGR
jgi:hypothetical protein